MFNIRSILAIFLGFSISLILLTNYRIFLSVGFGEIGLALFIAIVSMFLIVIPGVWSIDNRHKIVWLGLVYIFLFLLPITGVHFSLGTNGSSFRDWLSLALGYILLVLIIVVKLDVKITVRAVVFFTLVITLTQFFWGNSAAWYNEVRFTGGAKNPNQLTLYMICCLLLVAVSNFNSFLKFVFTILLLFMGVKAHSDGFNVFLVSVFLSFIGLKLLQRKDILILCFPFLAVSVLLGASLLPQYLELLLQTWEAADEGNTRITLYLHGITSWLDTPFTFLIGNGAGVFSGLTEAFQAREAHNTLIDLLAIGGVVGGYLFFYLPVKNIILAYSTRHNLVASLSIGLIIFSSFHFIARQPIFWFTIFAVSEYIWQQNQRMYKSFGHSGSQAA